jgi:hypothetical protein
MTDRALWTYAYSLRVELPSDSHATKTPKAVKSVPTPVAPAPAPLQPVAPPIPVVPTATPVPRVAARPRIKSLATSFMTRYQEP